jgi:hypothetical protein
MATLKTKEMTFPDGITRKVEEMDFSIIKEDWSEYQLDSGTYVKLKTVLHKVFWVLDDQGNRIYTAEGDPHLLVRSSNQVVASE